MSPTWLNEARHKIAEYETEDTLYAAGEVDGESTYFDGHPFSGLNRVIVQHAIRANRSGGDRLRFQLYRVPRDGRSTEASVTILKLVVGPGDHGEPVITILLPDED